MIQIVTTLLAAFLVVSPRILIPAPAEIISGQGTCVLPEKLSYNIVCKADTAGLASLERYIGASGLASGSLTGGNINIVLGDRKLAKRFSSEKDFVREAAYCLEVTPKSIEIKAITPKGAFYAIQSLRQMLYRGRELETCVVTDWPVMRYRGLMLDISRNFRDKEFIEKQIDAMALLKMDKLHLHLTDDAGWRIQIDSKPRLTDVAAWRVGETWSQWVDFGKQYSQKDSPRASGGYLTKDDVREIVAYAADRQIDIIPEFEIPGHSREVLEAYPELACIDAEGKPVMTSDMCPGSSALYGFIEDVVSELVELFPSEYIHIGGDEASREAWKNCPHCREVMEREHITSLAGLQSHVTGNVGKIIAKHGRKMIGWDEIMEGGLADNAVVMSWRGTKQGMEAMEAGHDVIMTPNAYYYLDYTQDAPIYQPMAMGGFLPLEKVYSYSPDADNAHLLGVQANVWTEHIPTAERLEYMTYPRAAAVAETGWSRNDRKDYGDFRKRASILCATLKSLGYNPFDIDNEFGPRYEYTMPVQHLALGKPVKVLTPYSEKYRACGNSSINDGLGGNWTYGDDRWLGFCSDIDIIIDLEESRPVHYAGAAFMSQRTNYVGLPERVEIWLSDDGENFTKAAVSYSELPVDTAEMSYVTLPCILNGTARYVRFKAFRRDLPFHDWLFIDEIVVN